MRYLIFAVVLLTAFGADAKRGKKRKKKAPQKTEQPAEPPADEGDGETAAATGDAPAESVAGKGGENGKVKIAVLDLASLGIDKDMTASLESYLRNSIGTIEAVDLIDHVDVQIALRKNKEVAGCGGGPKCAVQVGKLVQADVVVFGSVGGVGDAFNLNLRAMDVASGNELARQQASLTGTRHQLIPEMRLAAYGLIAPEKITGSLMVEIDVEGVEVEIDGLVVGTTPLKEPVKNLKPGSHIVVLKRPGYSQFEQVFEIEPFGTLRLQLNLQAAESAATP